MFGRTTRQIAKYIHAQVGLIACAHTLVGLQYAGGTNMIRAEAKEILLAALKRMLPPDIPLDTLSSPHVAAVAGVIRGERDIIKRAIKAATHLRTKP